jgi:hypothetical protein
MTALPQDQALAQRADLAAENARLRTELLTKPIDFTLLREEIDTRLEQAN